MTYYVKASSAAEQDLREAFLWYFEKDELLRQDSSSKRSIVLKQLLRALLNVKFDTLRLGLNFLMVFHMASISEFLVTKFN